PQKRQEFALTHIEIEFVERQKSVAEHLADATQRNDRRGRGRRHRDYFRRPSSVRNATQRLTSAAWWAGNSLAPRPIIGSKPMSRNFFWMSGWLTTSTIAAPSFWRTSSGIFGGP